jgi:hypothetical protein
MRFPGEDTPDELVALSTFGHTEGSPLGIRKKCTGSDFGEF